MGCQGLQTQSSTLYECAHLVVHGDGVTHHNALVRCSTMGAAPATTLLRAQRLLDELHAATVRIRTYYEGHVCWNCPFGAALQTVQSRQVWELVRVVGLLRRTPTRARAPSRITLIFRMATLTQSRALAGSKAFTGLRPRRVAQVANGGKVFMRRNDAYMIEVRTSAVNADAHQGMRMAYGIGCVARVATGHSAHGTKSCSWSHIHGMHALTGGACRNAPQVNVGEEEPEDIAIRRYMKAVMDSKVLDAVRSNPSSSSCSGGLVA